MLSVITSFFPAFSLSSFSLVSSELFHLLFQPEYVSSSRSSRSTTHFDFGDFIIVSFSSSSFVQFRYGTVIGPSPFSLYAIPAGLSDFSSSRDYFGFMNESGFVEILWFVDLRPELCIGTDFAFGRN